MKSFIFLIPVLIFLTQHAAITITPEEGKAFQGFYAHHNKHKIQYGQNKATLNSHALSEEYIPRRGFIAYVLELLVQYDNSKSKDKVVEYARYSFNPEQFREEFRERTYVYLRTPFFRQLGAELLAAKSTKDIVRTWDKYTEYKKSDLRSHYKENKEYYQGKETKAYRLKSELSFIKSSLGICIKDAINDPDFPEIKQKLEEER